MTSHAAVVARGMGKPCISAASDIQINDENNCFVVGERQFNEGDIITIDGSSGEVIAGGIKTVKPSMNDDFRKIMSWTDEFKQLAIRANAETTLDAETARQFGAQGIGLCRTEHMFFDEQRILLVRQMILADNLSTRNSALTKLLPYQKNDFIEIFTAMQGLPVTIRLLDPPLHEFLPSTENDIINVAGALNISDEEVRRKIIDLHEINPMLGHRGCRLAISYPEIYEMQCQAIFQAFAKCHQKNIPPVMLEIMIPLVSTAKELKILRKLIDKQANLTQEQYGFELNYTIGSMIELPAAALNAGEIAEFADFYSFGTNDLTQTTLGVSRDDARKFLDAYVEYKIFDNDPFVSLDIHSVGQLIQLACGKAKQNNPDIKLGLCGEHGGDPRSISFLPQCRLTLCLLLTLSYTYSTTCCGTIKYLI